MSQVRKGSVSEVGDKDHVASQGKLFVINELILHDNDIPLIKILHNDCLLACMYMLYMLYMLYDIVYVT